MKDTHQCSKHNPIISAQPPYDKAPAIEPAIPPGPISGVLRYITSQGKGERDVVTNLRATEVVDRIVSGIPTPNRSAARGIAEVCQFLEGKITGVGSGERLKCRSNDECQSNHFSFPFRTARYYHSQSVPHIDQSVCLQ